MAGKKKHFIKAAINPEHKGQFKAKAEAAGKSTHEYAEEKKGDKGLVGKQARLALTLMGMNHKHSEKKSHRTAKEVRSVMYGKGS